jgi:hypothetical protein
VQRCSSRPGPSVRRAVPVPSGTAVASHSRGTPLPAPPSGSPPEAPSMSWDDSQYSGARRSGQGKCSRHFLSGPIGPRLPELPSTRHTRATAFERIQAREGSTTRPSPKLRCRPGGCPRLLRRFANPPTPSPRVPPSRRPCHAARRATQRTTPRLRGEQLVPLGPILPQHELCSAKASRPGNQNRTWGLSTQI